ncbi:protein kinase [Archangium violaceum]|uniref:serine/threonine-protein kinase n=1 Tax=Archangium violaceum TaxID=83451 RepID=UPI00193BDE80|nr:serine/threonine-protein kinase [Archangium violaceum]QRK08251.1 protein kinase [Archangium violaceum]
MSATSQRAKVPGGGSASPPLEVASLGPYRLLEVLGQGGMGVVYRAVHRDTGEAVAVKTVRVAAESMLAGLRREIHALGRLHHPGVVRILDQGLHDGRPWYAMELLQGQTLRGHLDALRARREAGVAPPLGPTLTVLRRLCAPLAFLHGNGIVHRDLKPENIFLRPDGAPVLVDFGFAAQVGASRGREVLEVGGGIVGSEAYMAPEQIRGEFVDARTDLYALGCVLYEVVTGQPPFTDPRAGKIVFQHVQRRPVPPSRRVAGLPEGLDALVLRLLEKRPEDRLGYAEDVAAALASLGAEGEASAVTPRSPTYLYRPGFSGRAEALRVLRRGIDEARDGRGGCIYLGGESGVGKTRLALEAATEAAWAGLAVVTGECMPLDAGGGDTRGAPLHPFRPLLLAVADRCREQGAEETARLLGPRGKVLAAFEPGLADLPGLGALPEPPPLAVPAARARLLDALRDTLLAFARVQPLLLVLDDLQWADELSLAFLQSLRPERLEGHGVLVVGTWRLEEMGEALGELAGAPGAVSLSLQRLEAGSVGEMVRGMLALREPPAALVDFLVRHSSGNPFFIAEYLRTAMGEGMLFRDGDGVWRLQPRGERAGGLEEVLPHPRSLAELLERRLGNLGVEARALAQRAAVLGREFEPDLLKDTAGLDDTAAMETVEVLRLRQVLEDGEGGRLRFVHDKLREAAYARLPEEEALALHHRAAEALEARYAAAPDAARHSPVLGHHWARAKVHDRAATWLSRAAERARAAYATNEALGFYRSVLDELRQLPPETLAPALRETEARAYEGLGELLALTGRHEEARSAFARALARVPESQHLARARVHLGVGRSWEAQHRQEEALHALDAAEAALGPVPEVGGSPEWWHVWVQVQTERVSVHYWRARTDEGAALLQRVRPVVEERGTPLQRAHFFRALFQTEVRRERYRFTPEMMGHVRAYLAGCEEAGDEAEVCVARSGLAIALVLSNELDEAETHLRLILRLAERTEDAMLRARGLGYLALLHRMRARPEETRRVGAQALAVAEGNKMLDYTGLARANLAWVDLHEGRAAEAEQGFRAALTCWQPPAYVFPFQWVALLPLLRMALERNLLEEAVGHARVLLGGRLQRLPDDVARPFELACEGWERGDVSRVRETLDQALTSARVHGLQ